MFVCECVFSLFVCLLLFKKQRLYKEMDKSVHAQASILSNYSSIEIYITIIIKQNYAISTQGVTFEIKCKCLFKNRY